MKCTVLASRTRDFTYLYLREGFAFEDLPDALQQIFGEHREVMELELTPDRELAQVNVTTVLADLEREGFFLQLPPEDDPSGWLDLPPKRG